MVSSTVLRFLLAVCVLHCLVNFDLTEARRRKFKFCKINNLMECFNEPVAYFTSQWNGTGIASNEEEFEQYCFNVHDYLPYCIEKWMKRCGSEMWVELAKRIFIVPLQQSMKLFCDTKGTIRPKFLEHAQCLITEVKLAPEYRTQCVRALQANNEFIHDTQMKAPNVTGFASSFCCAYNQWEQCIVGFLRRNCGEAAATESIPHLIHHTTFDLLKSLCPHSRFDPEDSAKCNPEAFRAPKDWKPAGFGSNSIVSHMFSYLCPNIGWGVVPTNDF